MTNNIRIICPCGNEAEFNTINPITGKENLPFEGETKVYSELKPSKGFQVDIEPNSYAFQKTDKIHGKVQIECSRCNKTIYFYSNQTF